MEVHPPSDSDDVRVVCNIKTSGRMSVIQEFHKDHEQPESGVSMVRLYVLALAADWS